MYQKSVWVLVVFCADYMVRHGIYFLVKPRRKGKRTNFGLTKGAIFFLKILNNLSTFDAIL